MASGTINGTTSNQYIDVKIEWSSKANTAVATNNSTVTATLYYRRNNTGYVTSGTGTFTIWIGDSGATGTKHVDIGTDWVKVIETTQTVSHNTDGTKSVTISASGSLSGTTLSSTSCAKTVDLDTIPRATQMTSLSCSTAYFTGSLTYGYKTLSSKFYNRCTISVSATASGSQTAIKTINLGQKSGDQKATVTLTDSELSTLYTALPNTNNGYIRFTITTYSDSGYSSKVGDASYKLLKLYIQETAATKPTVTATLSPVSTLSSPFDALYIKGYSKVKATPSVTGKYGATIASIAVEVDGVSVSEYTSGYISRSGSIKVKTTAKDSRGFTNYIEQTINALDYTDPRVVTANGERDIVCARCDEDGNLTDSGTYLKIKARRRYSTCIDNGVQYNKCEIRYRYKKTAASSFSSWITLLAATNLTTEEVNSSPLLEGTLSVEDSYEVHVDAVDTFGNHAYAKFDIPTEKVFMERDGKRRSVSVGKYVEHDNAVEIAEDMDLYYKGDHVENKFFSLRGNEEIPSGADLNNYKKPNVYAISTDNNAKEISNMPPVERAGLLIVYAGLGQEYVDGGAWKYVIQEYKPILPNLPTYKRLLQTEGDSEWKYTGWVVENNRDTGWVSLGFADGVTKSADNYTRAGHGCFYRVVNGNHVYIAFNGAFTYTPSNAVKINLDKLPSEYIPTANAYTMCFTNNYHVAQIIVPNKNNADAGYIKVQHIVDATVKTSVTWIDGYIDYWI